MTETKSGKSKSVLCFLAPLIYAMNGNKLATSPSLSPQNRIPSNNLLRMSKSMLIGSFQSNSTKNRCYYMFQFRYKTFTNYLLVRIYLSALEAHP